MYVCMYVCMYASLYAYTHVFMYICTGRQFIAGKTETTLNSKKLKGNFMGVESFILVLEPSVVSTVYSTLAYLRPWLILDPQLCTTRKVALNLNGEFNHMV